jgi:RNA polymerase sigma-70 factor (ECF subfamily)
VANSILITSEKWYPSNTNTFRLAALHGRSEAESNGSGAVGRCAMTWRANGLAFKHIAQKRMTSLGLMGLSPADSRYKTNTDQMSDADIIRRVLDGDVDFFEHLLTRHRSRVFGIVSRHVPPEEVEEVAHDVFIRAFKSLAGYRHESNFQNWLSSIAVRTCHDFWRSRYRSREVAISGLSQPHQKWLEHVIAEESSTSFTEEINRKEAAEILRWALCQLPEKDKMVLELIYFQENSIKEAAKLLGWTQTAVKVRSFRSRQKLQKILSTSMKPNSEGL